MFLQPSQSAQSFNLGPGLFNKETIPLIISDILAFSKLYHIY